MPEHDFQESADRQTCRQMIAELLMEGPRSCRELSQLVHQSEKEVVGHLEHLRKSLRSKGLRLVIDPAVCRKCDYTFDQRTRLSKPGRCPECRQSTIEPPLYSIGKT